MSRICILLVLNLVLLHSTAFADPYRSLRELDRARYQPSARALGMGGATTVGAEGLAALLSNPGALPADGHSSTEVGWLNGFDDLWKDGGALHMAFSGWWDTWNLWFDYRIESYFDDSDDPELKKVETPGRERFDVGLNAEMARHLGLAPDRWQLRLGIAAGYDRIQKETGGERSIGDVDLGFTLRPRRAFGDERHLGWRAGLVTHNVLGMMDRAEPSRGADITGALGLEYAVYGRGPLPERVVKDVESLEPNTRFRPHYDRRRRRFDAVLSLEYTAYVEDRHKPALRLGMETSLWGIVFARAGWSDESRDWGRGMSWGGGLDIRLDDSNRIRLDVARAPMWVDGLIDETVTVVTLSLRGELLSDPRRF